MREHAVTCQIENKESAKYLQYNMNKYAVLYLGKKMRERGLSKEEQLRIVNELIDDIR